MKLRSYYINTPYLNPTLTATLVLRIPLLMFVLTNIRDGLRGIKNVGIGH